MQKNILKPSNFISCFLLEFINNIIIFLISLNKIIPSSIDLQTIQTVFNNPEYGIFIPIFTNSITLLYIYHLCESFKQEKRERIIIGSTIFRMKIQIPILYVMTNFTVIVFILLFTILTNLGTNSVCLIFTIISIIRLSILVIFAILREKLISKYVY